MALDFTATASGEGGDDAMPISVVK